MASHEHYVPAQSKWPIIASIGLLVTVFGLGTWFNDLTAGPQGIPWPVDLLRRRADHRYMLFGWFGNVIREPRRTLARRWTARSAGA